MNVTNTTIQNKSKQVRLQTSHTLPTHYFDGNLVSKFLQELKELDSSKEEILFSIGCRMLSPSARENIAVKQFLQDYKYKLVEIPDIPASDSDLLGAAYQYLNSKLENLSKGSFYTGPDISLEFVADLTFEESERILDPACGAGAFLFHSNAGADQIYGVDADPVAIMIAKFNYFLKFPEAGSPHLYCSDFFEWFSQNEDQRFEYIIGNPPYGANLDMSFIPSQYISSGESFSYFVEFCFFLLQEGGTFRFLLPEAMLNVKRHTDIRRFILKYTNLTRIKRYPKRFSGVMSDLYLIELKHGNSDRVEYLDHESNIVPKSVFSELKNQIFVNLSESDIEIIDKVKSLKSTDLSGSIFGLGVVTGDNQSKFARKDDSQAEPIYSGKEVLKYSLLPAKNFLVFNRANLQQVAPDEIYRATEKLVYKTISRSLKVALDTSGSLTTNSANLIIPNMNNYSIKSVMALLNSDLFSFLHFKLFGGVNKIAKENLSALPFPALSKSDDLILSSMVEEAMRTGEDLEIQRFVNEKLFELDSRQVSRIQEVVRGL